MLSYWDSGGHIIILSTGVDQNKLFDVEPLGREAKYSVQCMYVI